MGAYDSFEVLEADDLIGGSLTSYTPLEALFAEYRAKCQAIKQIAAYVAENEGAMSYFLDGARVEKKMGGWSVLNVFDKEPALRSLDALYWSRAMQLTDVLEHMPAIRRNRWHEMIEKHFTPRRNEHDVQVCDAHHKPIMDPIPPFERESVLATLQDQIAARQGYLAERVDGLFRALSGEHVTNAPQGFRKRMIISGVIGWYGTLNSDIMNYIHDLRCVIGKFMGRDVPHAWVTQDDLNQLKSSSHYGHWRIFDGGAWKLRLYKKGTAHMEIAPEMAYRLNQILAWMHPMAIPAEFRTKPTKKKKEFQMVHDLVPFEVLAELATMRSAYGSKKDQTGKTLASDFSQKSLTKVTVSVLEYLGGVKETDGIWRFDYPVKYVIAEIIRTGMLPEQKSHQFYPTPVGLAEEAVAWAEIGPEHAVLEPEAGQGGIADHLPKERTTCVEISPLHCKVLESKGFNTIQGDFLEWMPAQRWDRIVMNPPYADGRAEAHLRKAASLLQPGGILVAVLPAGFSGKTVIEDVAHEYSSVRGGEFKGASISVVLLKLTLRAAKTTSHNIKSSTNM